MVRPMPNAATLFPLKAFLSGVPSKERGRSKPYAVVIKDRRPFAIALLRTRLNELANGIR